MSISIYYLVEHGLSKMLADKLDENGFSIIDVLYTTPKAILANSTINLTLNKAKSVASRNSFEVKRDVYNSIYLLLKFGITMNVLTHLTSANLNKIDYLRNLTKRELDIILGRESNLFFTNIKDAITQLDSYVQQNKREVVALSILRKIARSEFGLSSLEVVDYLIEESDYESFDIYSTINYLVESNILEFEGNLIVAKRWSISDLLEMPFDDYYLLQKRLRGDSLEACRDYYNLSRQGIKNKQDALFRKLPTTIEETKYAELFKKYAFSQDSFCFLFSIDKTVWNYMSIKYERGKKTELEYIENEIIPYSIRTEYLNRNRLITSFTGELKHIDKQTIFDEVLFSNRNRRMTSDIFLKTYNMYNEDKGFDWVKIDHPKSINAIAERSKYAIQSIHGGFRFFDNRVPREFTQKLNELFDVLEGIYGIQKIYDDNLELMFDVELESGDELANLIKRIGLEKFPNVYKIHRQSQIQLGPISKAEFLRHKLEELSGSSVNEFVSHLFEEYGLKKESIIAEISSDYRHFIVNEKITVSFDIPDEEVFYIQLKDILADEIYLVDEFSRIIQQYWHKPLSVTQMLTQQVGYNLRGSYVVKQTFNSVNDAYRRLITSKDIFTVPDTKLFKRMDYFNVIYDLEKNLNIFKISEDTYLNYSKFNNSGVVKEQFRDFIKSTENSVKGRKYFTLPQIIEDGFDHELFELGFDDIFYERILATSESFKSITRKMPVLFSVGNDHIGLEKFLSDELFEQEKVNLDDFIDDLKNKYFIHFHRDNVKYRLQNYGAFYSAEMDKFYIDKETYYEEVYD